MLVEVDIRDFAIIEAARVELGPGLCVLTGETGAGKSIIVDAVGALLGERTGADMVRTGCETARLQAVFDLRDAPALVRRLAELGVEPDEDDLVVIAREIRADGRGRCRINGASSTVGMLREVGEALIDLHGQHEHQSLLRTAEHLALLDAAGADAIAPALAVYQTAYAAWRQTLAAIEALRLDEGERERRADMLRYQVDEIGAARLQPGELDDLRAEQRRLAHAERLLGDAADAHAALAESEAGPSAEDRLAAAARAVREMARWDDELAALADELDSAHATVGEAARTLLGYAEGVDADPRRLERVEERLDQIERLCRKYGGGIEAVLEHGTRAEAELDTIERSDERLAALEGQEHDQRQAAARAAAALSAAREAAAREMAEQVTAHLCDSGMQAVTFAAPLGRRVDPAGLPIAGEAYAAGPTGIDTVEFLFSANPGEPPRPLSRIASGGEISRVMLAVKSQLADRHAVPTMIFDEIDAGIGGVTIHHIARKMATLASFRQLICITHHAPIAALADWHVVIEKHGDEQVRTSVRRIDGDERVHELARMLGRVPPTEATLAMARELLENAARG